MAAWFAGRRGGTRGARRTAVRGALAAAIGAVLVCVAGLTVVVAGAWAGGSSGSSLGGKLVGAETSPRGDHIRGQFRRALAAHFQTPRNGSRRFRPRHSAGLRGSSHYTDNKNAFLDGDGHLVIEARKEGQPGVP